MKAFMQHTSIHLSLFFLLLVSCSKPTEFADYSNPYDELSSSYIPAPGLNTAEVQGILALEAWSGGEFTNDYGKPITAKGVCWSTEQNPTSVDNCTNEGGGLDAFQSHLTELEPDQTYYVRAYAMNSDMTIYGGQREFTTLDGRPVLATAYVSDITTASAQSGGEITDNGIANITSRGVCWSTSQNPTISDNCTINGSGIGSFTSSLTNLNQDTKYYVRAYATNAVGRRYGNQQEFRTKVGRDNTTTVVDVTNPATGRTWMDRNLGASRRATSSTDSQAYGDLYQWGRAADGHQKRNSSITSTRNNSDHPSHGNFILAPNSPFDWRNPQNNNLWQGVNGTNNPCPVGYRLPTEAEWEAERQSWSSNNRNGAYASPLKLPVAGYRYLISGSLIDVGSFGFYWSGTVDGVGSRLLDFLSSSAGMQNNHRAGGFSVRCLKD